MASARLRGSSSLKYRHLPRLYAITMPTSAPELLSFPGRRSCPHGIPNVFYPLQWWVYVTLHRRAVPPSLIGIRVWPLVAAIHRPHLDPTKEVAKTILG